VVPHGTRVEFCVVSNLGTTLKNGGVGDNVAGVNFKG